MFKKICLLIGILLFATACSCRHPKHVCQQPPFWPPANHPEWYYLDPALPHPDPSPNGKPPEWPGIPGISRSCGAGKCG